jgi:23S rRNA A1618 N6-methylase RlmF
MQSRLDILTAALEHRNAEVLHHQINIDNYRLAIAEIDEKHPDCPHMADFRARLADLLASSEIEQRKEVIMRDVIAKQLEG